VTKDPVGSLCAWETLIEVASQEFVIPAMSAAEWLAILMTDTVDPDHFIFIAEGLDEWLAAHPQHLERAYELVPDVITAVSGRDWWVAMRLISLAQSNWNVLGAEMLRITDADRVSLSAWLDMLLMVTMNRIEPKSASMFTAKLTAPPPGVKVDEEEMGMSASAFMALD
jgi:hypothetical protein